MFDKCEQMLYNIQKDVITLEEQTYKICTDASFESQTRIGTYGIVIMEENKVIKRIMKKCRIQLNNSIECEIFAIFQAFNIINSQLIKKEKTQNFNLKTDCQSARDFFTENSYNQKVFTNNVELLNTIKQTHKSIKRKLSKKHCRLQIKWIPRETNKAAHNCSISAFRKTRKKHKNKKSKEETILIEKESFLEILQKFNQTQYKVIAYLIKISTKENFIIKTQSEISKNLKIPLSTLNKTIQTLIKLNVLAKIKNGKYSLLI